MKGNGKYLGWGSAVLAALVLCMTSVFAFSLPGFGKWEKVQAPNGVIAVPLAKVSDGKAHFYSFTEKGKEYRFFMVKGSDGDIHTAFDACDVCFREKKGYQQQGSAMVCQNCNKRFEITRIGADSGGGCNPSHLPARNDGRTVAVKVSDLRSGAGFF